jgi:type IV pilus assembly protein PilP
MKRACIALVLLATACSAKDMTKNLTDGPSAPPPPARAQAPVEVDAGPPPVHKGMEYSENDFVESDRNRDPFRNYGGPVDNTANPPVKPQYEVKLADYAVDELKLVAIVLAGDGGRAMFLDPKGKGHVLMRGAYVGKPDLVRVGGAQGPEFQIHWRVDRIRDGDVVLIRVDPANQSIPPATRVISLHPEADKLKPG